MYEFGMLLRPHPEKAGGPSQQPSAEREALRADCFLSELKLRPPKGSGELTFAEGGRGLRPAVHKSAGKMLALQKARAKGGPNYGSPETGGTDVPLATGEC